MRTADSWTPTSPCGGRCLPHRRTLPRATLTCRVRRVMAIALLLVCGVLLAAAVPVLPGRVRRGAVRAWFTGVLAAFGVRLRVRGTPPRRVDGAAGTLVVSNHVSWLDVVALQAVCPMRLLAKAEVRGWPLLGALAVRAGTLFIDRGRPTRLPAAIGAVAEALRDGHVVGAFPEGTTWCGRESGRYRSAVFQAALDAGARVRPAALRYELADGGPTTVAAFVGEDTLLGSLREVLAVRGLVVELILLPPPCEELPAGRRIPAARRCATTAPAGGTADHPRAPATRRELADHCARAITEASEPRPRGNHWTSTEVEVATSCGERSKRTGDDGHRDGTGTWQSTVGTAVP